MNEEYDVIVAGGGVAGLTCARHIALEMPHLKIAIIERQERPLPRFGHKVGESSLAPQGNYLAHTLKLRDYLQSQHVEKFGVRYFFSDAGDSFSERPEVGGSKYFGIEEFQFDRGKLETDLREMNVDSGIDLLEGYVVRSVDSDNDGHSVSCKPREEGNDLTLRSRWLIDATGRRRLVHGSESSVRGECSAAWWRVDGWIDVDEFVSDSEAGWKARVDSSHPRAERFGRVNSTTHLCGPGYWVWLIPLPDNGMSVGIVATETLVPFESYNSYEKALEWLKEREPELAARLDGLELIDFKFMRKYSYPAKEVLPAQRIGVIGEAVGFSDPFYSPGGDAIAVANTLIVGAIKRDEQGSLSDDTRAEVNEFFSTYLNGYTAAIHSIYPCLGSSRIATCHVIWDFCSLISLSERLLQERDLIGQIEHSDLKKFLDDFFVLTRSVDKMCLDYWKDSVSEESTGMPSLAPNKMVNHRDAFLSLMNNTDRLLKRLPERVVWRTRRVFGKPKVRDWNRDRYLEILGVIAEGMKAYLAESAMDGANNGKTKSLQRAGSTQAKGCQDSALQDRSAQSRVPPPGLVERVTNDIRWAVGGLGGGGQRERLTTQLSLKWWKAGMQE